MYAAAELHRADMVRRHAADALTADAAADVGQACDVLRGVVPVVGSLTSTRALGLVGAVRGRLAGYRQVTAVQELERDLDECVADTGS
jgi:hypothetical protein